jgi:uncharacterized LabA/DUF88 family protein
MHAMWKTLVFIDAEHLNLCAEKLHIEIDYEKLLTLLEDQGSLLHAYIFVKVTNAYAQKSDQRTTRSIKSFTTFLANNGYLVQTKSLDCSQASPKSQSTVEIDISVAAFERAAIANEIILFVGSANYCHLVKSLQRKGPRITIASAMAEPELLHQADDHIDLTEWREKIDRKKPTPEHKSLPLRA